MKNIIIIIICSALNFCIAMDPNAGVLTISQKQTINNNDTFDNSLEKLSEMLQDLEYIPLQCRKKPEEMQKDAETYRLKSYLATRDFCMQKDVKVKNPDQNIVSIIPLHYICSFGSMRAFYCMIDHIKSTHPAKEKDCINMISNEEHSILSAIGTWESFSGLKLKAVLELGANANWKDKEGNTFLMDVVDRFSRTHEDYLHHFPTNVIEVVVPYTDFAIKNKEGKTVWDLAKRSSKVEELLHKAVAST